MAQVLPEGTCTGQWIVSHSFEGVERRTYEPPIPRHYRHDECDSLNRDQRESVPGRWEGGLQVA